MRRTEELKYVTVETWKPSDASSNLIVSYTAPWCNSCTKMKEYLANCKANKKLILIDTQLVPVPNIRQGMKLPTVDLVDCTIGRTVESLPSPSIESIDQILQDINVLDGLRTDEDF